MYRNKGRLTRHYCEDLGFMHRSVCIVHASRCSQHLIPCKLAWSVSKRAKRETSSVNTRAERETSSVNKRAERETSSVNKRA